MNDYIFLMHDDAPPPPPGSDPAAAWTTYLATLRATGRFAGGSSIGDGACFHKAVSSPKRITAHLVGYLRVQASSLDDARTLLAGNPAFEAGGTVEIRELPRD